MSVVIDSGIVAKFKARSVKSRSGLLPLYFLKARSNEIRRAHSQWLVDAIIRKNRSIDNSMAVRGVGRHYIEKTDKQY